MTDADMSTYEIFETLEDANKFAYDGGIGCLYIFTANFDESSIYREPEDGAWNYEDHAVLFENHQLIHCLVCDTEFDSQHKTIEIEILGGVLVDVRNLPDGWNYKLIDWDDH